jgi:hypothetical protein
MTDAELLRAQIEASGLSQVRFALDVMGRNPATVRRWLAGHTMPATARDWLSRVSRLDVTDSTVRIDVLRP